jgi:biopolymer transport protein ExbD
MPLKTQRDENVSMNLTPMVDVLFLLIIFFMVGTKFADMERQFDVELPEAAEAAPLTNPPQEIIVNVYADGRLVVDQEEIKLPALRDKLTEAHAKYADQAVLIRGDRDTPYKQIVQVLSACQQAQIRNKSLSVRLETGSISR